MTGKTLTRADLADAVVRKVGLPRNESQDLVELILGEISSTLAAGEPVKLSSFGSFGIRQKGQRVGRNPKTGKEVPITPRRVLVFRPSNVMKERINAGSRRTKAAAGARPAPAEAAARAAAKAPGQAGARASTKAPGKAPATAARTGTGSPRAATAGKSTAHKPAVRGPKGVDTSAATDAGAAPPKNGTGKGGVAKGSTKGKPAAYRQA
jgi:integration host factor subunit alpha